MTAEAKANPQRSANVESVEDQPGETEKAKDGAEKIPPAHYVTSVEELIKISITEYDITKVTGQQKRINPETGEPEPDPKTGAEMVPKLALSPTQASGVITGWLPLRLSATDENEKDPVIWRLDESGIWRPDGEKVVKQIIDAVCGDLSTAFKLSETMRRIRTMSDIVVFDADPYLFPAQDCLIDLRTGLSRNYREDDYVTFRYSAALHNPDADYHRLLWFLCTTYPDPRDVLTALDILAASVIRVAFDAIIQLIGPGGNGKHVFESLLAAWVTPDRRASTTLSEAKKKFGLAAILSSDVWIMPEAEKEINGTMDLLKRLSAGDPTDDDVKYKVTRVKGTPWVKPILDSNVPIAFEENTWARMRRWNKLDHPYIFLDHVPDKPDSDNRIRPRDPSLAATLTTPAVLSGLLQIVVTRAPYLCKTLRIYNRKQPEEMNQENLRQQDSPLYFCNECLTTDPTKAINPVTEQLAASSPPRLTPEDLLTEYTKYSRLFSVPTPIENTIALSRYISKKYGISSINTTENGKQFRYYPGLWISRSARQAHEDFTRNYGNYGSNTDELQMKKDKNSIYRLLTTDTTDEYSKEVVEEIACMFEYIYSCETHPKDILYEKFKNHPNL